MSVRDYWSRVMMCSSCGRIICWWELGLESRADVALGPFLCSAPIELDGGCDAWDAWGRPIRFDWKDWLVAFDYFDGPPAGGGL